MWSLFINVSLKNRFSYPTIIGKALKIVNVITANVEDNKKLKGIFKREVGCTVSKWEFFLD